MTKKKRTQNILNEHGPAVEKLKAELDNAKTIDDFVGKDGIFARLFGTALEKMMEAELDDHLGYEAYEAKGRNSGNSRNGTRKRKIQTSSGETEITVPRDRAGTYQSQLLEPNRKISNELEEKLIYLYAKGTSTRDIKATMRDLYGVNVSEGFISDVTDKIEPELTAWQNRLLDEVYPIVYLDALYVKLRRNGHVSAIPIYTALGVNLEGKKDVLGFWIGETKGESANYWLTVLTEIQNRGVKDILICSVDGLNGFSTAIESVFQQTVVQRCIVHQIRNSFNYVTWTDRKEFAVDLRKVYTAPTCAAAEVELTSLEDKWQVKYPVALQSWRNNWAELSRFFDFSAEIRRLIYTTNPIEGYNRQLRKVLKTKGALPSEKAVLKLLYLRTRDIEQKWSMPMHNWPLILNQLAIRFEGRMQQ